MLNNIYLGNKRDICTLLMSMGKMERRFNWFSWWKRIIKRSVIASHDPKNSGRDVAISHDEKNSHQWAEIATSREGAGLAIMVILQKGYKNCLRFMENHPLSNLLIEKKPKNNRLSFIAYKLTINP